MNDTLRASRGRTNGFPLLVVSNRLPVRLRRRGDGSWFREPASGGLVTALEPVLRRRGGTWVGWPGVVEEEARGLDAVLGASGDPYRVEPVPLTAVEQQDFYLGLCNEVLWPLFHGLVDRCRFEPRYWEVYRRVNRKYARAIMRTARPGQVVWVHDYHLMDVGRDLRAAGCDNKVGFFLHIPFPPPDLLERLPWGRELLHALLSFDTIGFQTRRDWRNFLDCVRLFRSCESRVQGAVVLDRDRPDRPVRVGVHPISIDGSLFCDGARTDAVAARAGEIRAEIAAEQVLLGVDRLDYTKGIPEKLLGFERSLERYPDLHGRMALVQLVVPSRVAIPEYRRVKGRIEGLVGRINGRFSRGGWVPVRYRFGSWSRSELLAHYRAADVALVTPVRDGMNLVSKEYVAASVERGTLVLSRFAGSADELRDGALLVNPHDVDGMAESLRRALTMPRDEQRERLAAMRSWVLEHDVHHWVRGFLARAMENLEPEAEARRVAALWAGGSAVVSRPEASRPGRVPARPRAVKRAPPGTLPSRDRPAAPPS